MRDRASGKPNRGMLIKSRAAYFDLLVSAFDAKLSCSSDMVYGWRTKGGAYGDKS